MATSEVEKAEAVEVARTEHTRNGRHYRPNVDILESAGELTVFADMPGTTGDDIDINFENGTLTIHGKVRNCEPEDAGPVSREYGVGDFHRTFQVSEKVDASNITAEHADGVLTLHLPKVEAVKPRKILVQAK